MLCHISTSSWSIFAILNKIPGEEFSASHVVSLFICNIKDEDYKQEISILKTSNKQKCVQATRKGERELVRTRAEHRKLRQLPKRLWEEDLALPHSYKLRQVGDGILSAEVPLTNRRFIHLQKEWYRSLNEQSQDFIRKYNREVCSGIVSPSIQPLLGVTLIPSTPRLVW